MTFAFDRKPFQWAAIRIGRHVREIARARSKDQSGLGRRRLGSHRWQKLGHNAELQKVLQGAQTKRLLLGDDARYEGAQAVRASEVLCKCGNGPCSTAHWFFDCTLPVAVVHRGLLLHKVRETGRVLELSDDGGREHGPTVIIALALRRADTLGVIERRVAFRWLVGCIPRPLASTAEAKACAVEALKLGAVGLRQARTIYCEAQELFTEAESARGLGVKYGRVWMARTSLSAGSPSRFPRRARGDPGWRSVAGVTRGSAHQSSAANESPGWSGRQPPPTGAESRHRDSPHRGADSATPAPESALKTRAEWPRKVGESPCARGPVGAVWGGVGTLLGRLGGLRKATRADTGATRTHRGLLEGPTRRTRRAHSLGRVGPSPVASRPRRVRLAAATRPLGGPLTRPRATN